MLLHPRLPLTNRVFRLAAVVTVAIVAASCAGRSSGTGILPRAAVTDATATPAPYQPAQAFEARSDGSLVRRVYRAGDGAPLRAEIVDLLVPPGKTATLAFDGAVIVEAREGSAAASAREKNVTLDSGKTFGLSQGETANVENRGKDPLLLRIYIVSVR